MNQVIIAGYLGKDPVLRRTADGTAVCDMSVATTERTGSNSDRTEWHRVVLWEKLAENCAKYLKKGSYVCLSGAIQTRKWTDTKGETRTTTEIRARSVEFGPRTPTDEHDNSNDNSNGNDDVPF